jgi:hypothetical protein
MDTTTIQIDKEIKSNLDKLKIHHRETYNELLDRLINNTNPANADRESLIATIEVLSDPELMKGLAESLKRTSSGDYGTPLEDVKKELGLEDV